MRPRVCGYSVRWFSDRCLRVSVDAEDHAATDVSALTLAACDRLRAAGIPNLVDVTPAASAALLTFDLSGLDAPGAERAVRAVMNAGALAPPGAPAALVEIPVCYAREFAPDAEALAAEREIDEREIGVLHAGAEYRVDFLGFMPGFAYLSGLPAALHAPRLARPRTRVPAGSVGIADERTGVYPAASPGGWRLIGRTPLRMFDPLRARPSVLIAGDRVRFRAITPSEFLALAGGGR